MLTLLLALACAHHAPPLDLAHDCPAILADPAAPDPVAAEAARAAGSHWSNVAVRARYLCEVAEIGPAAATWAAEGRPAEERARLAFTMRHDARMLARAMMADQAQVEQLRARDSAKYGNPDGPTFESLVEAKRADGLTGDALYESIVESAQRTNQAVNFALGL